MSGFPDNHHTFLDTLVPQLSQNHRCLVACLPDMDQPRLSRTWGYSQSEVIQLLDQTIKSFTFNSPLVLVLHDWGAIYGLEWYFKNNTQVSKIVCLDVLTTDPLKAACENSFSSVLWLLLYQWWFVCSFIVGRILPVAGDVIMWLLSALRLGPDRAPPPAGVLCPPRGPRSYMCYPYFHYWWDKIRSHRISAPFQSMNCPLLYVYGLKKRLFFHSSKDMVNLIKDPRHRVIAYDCGHWIQHAKTAELANEIDKFCL